MRRLYWDRFLMATMALLGAGVALAECPPCDCVFTSEEVDETQGDPVYLDCINCPVPPQECDGPLDCENNKYTVENAKFRKFSYITCAEWYWDGDELHLEASSVSQDAGCEITEQWFKPFQTGCVAEIVNPCNNDGPLTLDCSGTVACCRKYYCHGQEHITGTKYTSSCSNDEYESVSTSFDKQGGKEEEMDCSVCP